MSVVQKHVQKRQRPSFRFKKPKLPPVDKATAGCAPGAKRQGDKSMVSTDDASRLQSRVLAHLRACARHRPTNAALSDVSCRSRRAWRALAGGNDGAIQIKGTTVCSTGCSLDSAGDSVWLRGHSAFHCARRPLTRVLVGTFFCGHRVTGAG
jgi:hypothetical protein